MNCVHTCRNMHVFNNKLNVEFFMFLLGISSVLERMSYLDFNRQEGYHTPPPHFPDHSRHPEVSYHYYQEYRGSGVESVCYVEKVYPDQARPDVYHVERLYPEVCHQEVGFHSYENPSSPTPATVGLGTPRTPQRIIYTHRRTSSNVSDHSNASSSVNPSFRTEDNDQEAETLSHSLPPVGPFHSPYVTVIATSLPNTPRRKNSQDSAIFESSGSYRSLTYSKLKSNVDSTSSPTRSCLITPSPNDGTPTNGTPLNSSRSSSNEENGSASRVRFSIDESDTPPVVKTVNKAAGTEDLKTLLDIPSDGQSQDSTVPLSDVMKISDQRQSSVR